MNKSEIAESKQCPNCEGYGVIEGKYCDCSVGQMAVRDAKHVAVAYNHETGKNELFVCNHKKSVERAIAESRDEPPHVTMQMLVDAGLNAFGLQLFCESFASGLKPTLNAPFAFKFRGLKFTVERVEGEEIDTRHH